MDDGSTLDSCIEQHSICAKRDRLGLDNIFPSPGRNSPTRLRVGVCLVRTGGIASAVRLVQGSYRSILYYQTISRA